MPTPDYNFKDLQVNLDAHDDYLRYLQVDYPKYLADHAAKEIRRQKFQKLDETRLAEAKEAARMEAEDSRHRQLLSIAIVALLISLASLLVSLH